MRTLGGAVALLAVGLAACGCPTVKTPAAVSGSLSQLKLPPGFEIRYYADNVPGARSLALGPEGVLFVGTRPTGDVYAVLDRDKDHRAEAVLRVATGLNHPNGVAYRDGSLYVAEIHRVIRFDAIDGWLKDPSKPAAYAVVRDDFPDDASHGWKFIRFGPDGKLYVPVGAPCNVCEAGPMYSAIHRMNPDGSGLETFARGVRNTVGFDWHPSTKELWFTDNGRDMLGDDLPPDELNHAPRAGMDFGFPYCHGASIADPKFGKPGRCAETTAPAVELGPHVAALGMRFYTGKSFPARYRGAIFIAEHGSWNRSEPIGYRVTVVSRGDGGLTYETFADGWLQSDGAFGRPVDVEMLPDGSLLVSDDRGGKIYRISYRGE